MSKSNADIGQGIIICFVCIKFYVPNTIWIKMHLKANYQFLETVGLWEKEFEWHRRIVLTVVVNFASRNTWKDPRLSGYKMKLCYNKTTLTFNLVWILQNINNRVINCTIKGCEENYKLKWYDQKKRKDRRQKLSDQLITMFDFFFFFFW